MALHFPIHDKFFLIDQQSGDRAEEVKISHEETNQRLRQFIKKRTVNEAFNSTADKSGVSYQPW